MPTSQALVLQGDALHLPIADETVDLVVTSPPYFSLRDYGTGHPAEVGSEPTPAEFLAALWAATAELKRVLKPTGSAFINLGDKYSTTMLGRMGNPRTVPQPNGEWSKLGRRGEFQTQQAADPGVREKSLLLLPEAYRLGCTGMLAQLGGPDPGLNLIARAVIVQSKINGIPESVTDRVRRSHEDWVHLTKSTRYYSAVDELREPHADSTLARAHLPRRVSPKDGVRKQGNPIGLSMEEPGTIISNSYVNNPLGKLPGSVWSIASEPLDLPDYLVRLPTGVTMMDAGPLWRHVAWMRATGQPGPVIVRELDHYAAFASELPRRLILGFSPPGICVDCGHGRFPVVESEYRQHRPSGGRLSREERGSKVHDGGSGNWGTFGTNLYRDATILGYACACTPHTDHPGTGDSERNAAQRGTLLLGRSQKPRGNDMERVGPWREYHLNRWKAPPTRPAVILDPFGGVGTTAAVAVALGRIAVTVDLGYDYSLAAQWRVRYSPILAKTAQRTNNDAQAQAVDPGPPVPVPPKPPTLTYRDPAVKQANHERQGTLL
jgi:hypothetical protein